MKSRILLSILLAGTVVSAAQEPFLSTGRRPDSTEKRVAEIRESERRQIPLEVALQTDNEYRLLQPVQVTIMITNLFDAPLVLNRRLLVNHPRLKGEVSFLIRDPDGKPVDLQRLVTPISVRDEDFVVLPKGHSIQRTIDLSDLFGFKKKGVYRVQATYHNELDQPLGELRAWKGLVHAPPVDLHIN